MRPADLLLATQIPGDPLGHLMEEPGRARELGAAGRAYAREHLGVAAAHRDCERWGASLAASRTPPGRKPHV